MASISSVVWFHIDTSEMHFFPSTCNFVFGDTAADETDVDCEAFEPRLLGSISTSLKRIFAPSVVWFHLDTSELHFPPTCDTPLAFEIKLSSLIEFTDPPRFQLEWRSSFLLKDIKLQLLSSNVLSGSSIKQLFDRHRLTKDTIMFSGKSACELLLRSDSLLHQVELCYLH